MNNKASFPIKNLIYSFLLCIFFNINFYGNLYDSFIALSIHLNELNQLEPPYWLWIMFSFVIIYQGFILFLSVFLLQYLLRLSLSKCLLTGILFNYLSSIFVLKSVWESNGGVFLYYFLGSFVFSLLASYFGWQLASDRNPFETTDKELNRFYGISKKIWVLLIFCWNPIILNANRLTALTIQNETEIIQRKGFWLSLIPFIGNTSNNNDGIGILLKNIGGVAIIWILLIAIYISGLNAIKNKTTRFRVVRITITFVIIPLLVLIIPLIRNKYWFY